MNPISILIADDHALIRQTWTFIFNTNPRFKVVGESSTGEQTVALAGELRPDLVIMDINMPGLDGMEATRLIAQCAPATKVIAVTSHAQPAYARRMMQCGALGYVTKSSPSSEFFTAIDTVLSGKRYICQQIKDSFTEELLSGERTQAALHALTAREREIIGLVREGWPSARIAQQLFISEKTVEVHRYNILKKLNLKNTPALINYINTNLVC